MAGAWKMGSANRQARDALAPAAAAAGSPRSAEPELAPYMRRAAFHASAT
jgi:hypothetical protein